MQYPIVVNLYLIKYLVQKPRKDSENVQKITHINLDNLQDKDSENLQKITLLNFENLQQKDLTEKNIEEPEARNYIKNRHEKRRRHADTDCGNLVAPGN